MAFRYPSFSPGILNERRCPFVVLAGETGGSSATGCGAGSLCMDGIWLWEVQKATLQLFAEPNYIPLLLTVNPARAAMPNQSNQ